MDDNQPKNVAVRLTVGLAARSLAAANDAGLSRSELVRQLLLDHLDQSGSDDD